MPAKNCQESLTAPFFMRWVLVLVLASAWWVFTWNNGFPYYYHPDEPSKVRQVQREYRNFHHPLMLLNTVQVVAGWGRAAGDEEAESQRIVAVGRLVAGFFGAVAVAGLVAVGWSLGGVRVGLMLWPLLVLHEQLFELSHYFKEDTALLAGLVVGLLAVVRYGRRPSFGAAVLVGTGMALAASGKYVGVLGSVVCLGVFLWQVVRCGGGWQANRGHVAVAAVAAASVLLVVNWQLLTVSGRADFAEGLGREADFAIQGHKGTTRSVPHSAYTASFSRNTNAVLWVFLLAHGVWLWRNRRRVVPAHWAVVVFSLLYILILSLSPKVSDRYFLPATGFLLVLAALGVGNLADWITGSRRIVERVPAVANRTLVFSVLAVAGVLPMLPDFFAYAAAFREDDRKELITYIRDQLPATAKIAQDGRVNLPGDPKRKFLAARAGEIPQVVQGAAFAADVGTLDELLDAGFTHVAVCKGDYERFFLNKIRPRQGAEDDFSRRHAFYQRLFEHARLVWERKPGELNYLQPGLKLYSLDSLRSGSEPAAPPPSPVPSP